MRAKFGVDPVRIPDLLALVGDSADGYPGIPGIGKVTAARLVNEHGPIEDFPASVLGDKRELALLFKDLATLRTELPLFESVDELRWRGPTRRLRGVGGASRRWPAARPLHRGRRRPPLGLRRHAARTRRRRSA